MQVLEIMCEGSEVVRAAHDQQREALRKHFDFYSLDFTSKGKQDRARELEVVKTPDVIIVRGFRALGQVTKRFPRTPVLLDHCAPYDMPDAPPGSHLLRYVRAICYSKKAAKSLSRAGLVDVQVLPGPVLADCREAVEKEGPVRVGVLPGYGDQPVLRDLIRISKAQEWNVEIFSTLPAVGAEQVSDVWELVEESDVLIGPHETEDLGAPCDAAILALAYGRGLVAPRLGALDKLPYGAGGIIYADRYTTGSYTAALRHFLEKPDKWEDWVLGASYPTLELKPILEKMRRT